MKKIDREAVLAAMPTNWCDSLLTGDKAVLPKGGAYGNRDIEKLLLAIRDRVLAMPVEDAPAMRPALEAAAACFDTLDPRQPSGLSDAETASLFNATREAVRLALT